MSRKKEWKIKAIVIIDYFRIISCHVEAIVLSEGASMPLILAMLAKVSSFNCSQVSGINSREAGSIRTDPEFSLAQFESVVSRHKYHP